ncbi:uncharacterized protein TRIADDRAFT_19638, partial [Trichoplax adhaerens]
YLQLEGQVEDCHCQVETVDKVNNLKIFPLLQTLVQYNYFKFYPVNLIKPCPFWHDDNRCVLRHCSVNECKETELPAGLRGKPRLLNKRSSNDIDNDVDCKKYAAENDVLGKIDSTLTDQDKRAFVGWKQHDDSGDNFCDIDDENASDVKYVNLLLNPERFTGYGGKSAHRIWKTIYNENCFTPAKSYKDIAISGFTQGLCLEKRAFFRLISGMHASVNIHLSAKYLLPATFMRGKSSFRWGPNVHEFQNRFSSENTNGEGPLKLKNLYFAYLVLLRAVTKAAPYWEKMDFYTGNTTEDESVKRIILDIVSIAKSNCNGSFDETELFAGEPEKALALKKEFRDHFRNISKIMDCVGCNKCRLWGKIQVRGIGTALKILFSVKNEALNNADKFHLKRPEIISLINTLARYYLSNFKFIDCRHRLQCNQLSIGYSNGCK